MFWQISAFPKCTHHAFLSHAAIDRQEIVLPVSEELQRRQIIPWLDQNDYPYGRDSRIALRDGILHSRHIVYFITLGMLDHRNGWCPMELAYSDILQKNLMSYGGTWTNLELPLFFVDRNDPHLNQTIWGALRDRGPSYSQQDGDIVEWSVNQIQQFLLREQLLSLNHAKNYPLVTSPGIPQVTGLFERVTQFDPGSIPIP